LLSSNGRTSVNSCWRPLTVIPLIDFDPIQLLKLTVIVLKLCSPQRRTRPAENAGAAIGGQGERPWGHAGRPPRCSGKPRG
jgi:hypothetical protein